jgi:hypothetical protein
MDNRGRIDEILKEGPRVPRPASHVTGKTVTDTPSDTPQKEADKGRYVAFTRVDSTEEAKRNEGFAGGLDLREQYSFKIHTPDIDFSVHYGTYLGCDHYKKRNMLHLLTSTRQYVIEGRNLGPLQEAFERKAVLKVFMFDVDCHTMPQAGATIITNVSTEQKED